MILYFDKCRPLKIRFSQLVDIARQWNIQEKRISLADKSIPVDGGDSNSESDLFDLVEVWLFLMPVSVVSAHLRDLSLADVVLLIDTSLYRLPRTH